MATNGLTPPPLDETPLTPVTMGRRGGNQRAANLSAEERSAIARTAVKARWEKYRSTHPPAPVDEHRRRIKQSLTPEQLQQRGRNAVMARWNRRRLEAGEQGEPAA